MSQSPAQIFQLTNLLAGVKRARNCSTSNRSLCVVALFSGHGRKVKNPLGRFETAGTLWHLTSGQVLHFVA